MDITFGLLTLITVFTIGQADDIDNPSIGVKLTHKGYLTAASSHYVHTIRINAIPMEHVNGQNMPYNTREIYDCNKTLGS